MVPKAGLTYQPGKRHHRTFQNLLLVGRGRMDRGRRTFRLYTRFQQRRDQVVAMREQIGKLHSSEAHPARE